MIALVLIACKSPTPTPLLPTGWFSDTGDSDAPQGCRDDVVQTRPEAGDAWYWRDSPRISVSSDDRTAYQAYVIDAEGYRLPSELVWTDGSLTATVQLDAPLRPDSDHVLRIVDCEGTREVPFRTSTLGLPFEAGVTSIAGKTFHVDLQGADWVQPAGIAALLTLYFDSPGLIDVAYVTDQQLQLRFTLGYYTDGEIRQDSGRQLIPFPTVGFGDNPYFEAQADRVDLSFSGATIPVYDFAFSGTFSASGSAIGGASVSGIGDTRFAGQLLGDDSPDAICSLAAGFGVQCVMCPTDRLPYCLPVSVVNVEGTWLPHLTLQP